MTDIVDDILHYGVKGMKWGKRRKSSTKERTTYKKAPRTLSDADLKKRIARLENEKRYNELNKRHISAGRAATTEILASSGKSIAKSVAVGVGTVLVKSAVEAKFGSQYSDAIRLKK